MVSRAAASNRCRNVARSVAAGAITTSVMRSDYAWRVGSVAMRRILVAATAACVLIAADAIDLRAWGPQGHRLVGLIAAARLSPMAQVNVAWLLDKRTLADVS